MTGRHGIQRRTLLLALAIMGLLAARGDPFSRPYVVALKNITMEGDLFLPNAVQTLALGEKTSVEVWLEHKLEVLDYGQVRSRFILHPFETGIFPRGPDAFVWFRPGGGEIKFSAQRKLSIEPPSRWPKNWRSRIASPPVDCYEGNRAELWISGTGRQVICEEGWELYHRNGALEAIISPNGAEWIISAQGKRISSITRNGVQVVAINWNPDLTPEKMVTELSTFQFLSDARSLLREVHNQEHKIYAFMYDERGLIRRADMPLAAGVDFVWSEVPDFTRGDSRYALPFTVARAGAMRYEYENDHGVISLRALSAGKEAETLEITTRYGRIISVR